MVNLMRRYQQAVMMVVTVVVIISFVWFYNGNTSQRSRADRVGTLYNRPVGMAEYSRESRKFEICRALGLYELWTTLIGRQARTESEAVESFVWNSLVLRHQANALGLSCTDEEVIAAVQKLPSFQTNGAYDSTKYNNLVQNIASRGFTADVVEDLVRDDLFLTKLKNLVGTSVHAAPSEVRSLFERRNQKSEISYVKLNKEDFLKAAQVSEEDLKKIFEERKNTLNTEELRKVRFLAFTLPKAEKPLEGKQRVAEMSKLADRAQEFSVAMAEKDAKIEEAAKKFGVSITDSTEFTLENLPAGFAQSEAAAQTIFEKLTLAQPNSDVVMVADSGYFVFQLAGITPARPLSFEEAKEKLAAQTKEERAEEALNLKASEVRNKIHEALKAGKSFTEAASAVALKPQSVPAFSMAEPPKSEAPEVRIVAERSSQLAAGELSEPLPSGDGSLLVYVDKRLPIDETKLEAEKTILVQNLSRAKRESAFELWLKDSVATAKSGSKG